jgi:MFS family permease
MNKTQQSVIFINYFSMGLLMPVLNLILLERGADLKTLPLLIGLYALSALVFELPSGICGDLLGRKTAFLISAVMKLFSLTLLIAADDITLLIPCVILNGMSRAFSSGSLDALFIEQAVETYGQECIPTVSSRLSIQEAAGFAAGSILGGFISYVGGTEGVILVQGGLTIAVFLLCAAGIREKKEKKERKENEKRVSLGAHLRMGKEAVISSGSLKYVLLGMFFTGLLISSIETYWQPVYLEVSVLKDATWTLGLVSFMGFFLSAMGNAASEKLLIKYPFGQWKVYGICRLSFSLILVILSLQTNTPGFLLGYAGFYLFHGMGNVAENTLINQYTPNHIRASILSLSSFVFQLGCLSASLASSFLAARIPIQGIWKLSGNLCFIFLIILLVQVGKRNKTIINPITP